MQLRYIVAVFSLAVACAASAEEPQEPSLDAMQANLAKMQKKEAAQIKQLKRDLVHMPESALKEEIKTLIARIEKTPATPVDLYVTPASPMTQAMKTYYAKMQRRIEDCGTRHLPIQDGKTLYGQGVVGVTLARDGTLVDAEVMDSSMNALVDEHMVKLVRASAPFGPHPANPVTNSLQGYRHLIVVTGFHFTRDNTPLLKGRPKKDRCQWK